MNMNNQKVYKPSIFNRIVKDNENIVLYNSCKGTTGILIVEKSKKQKICEWLNSEKIVESGDMDLKKLIEYGYLVPYDVDEKLIRQVRYQNHLSDGRLSLVIHTTQACNFRCSYCYMDFKDEKMKLSVQDGIINFVRKNIQKYKSVQVSWFGGEPLLGMDVIEYISESLIEICKNQKKPYSAIITTNGYNLSPKNIEKLLKYKVTHIAVTIDGSKKLHDKQRVLKNGAPTFDHIIENLLYIKNNIRSHTLSISIRNNITQEHLNQIEEYYQYFDEQFGSDRRFSLFIRPVADYGGERVENMRSVFLKSMKNVYKKISEIQNGIKCYPNFIDLEFGGYTCPARNYNKYTIGCDGGISKCDEDLEEKIGFLDENGKMDINEFEHAKWIANMFNEKCDNCFFSGSCFMGMCPKSKVVNGKEVCTVNSEEIDELILLASKSYIGTII